MIPRSSTARSIHYYNGAYLNRYGGNDYEFYQLQLPEDNAFSVGERVSVDFVKNEESLPEGGSNYYLFLQFQNGEIEIVRQFRAKIAGKESFKGAVLRLMKEASK